jgi:hypothetical protein
MAKLFEKVFGAPTASGPSGLLGSPAFMIGMGLLGNRQNPAMGALQGLAGAQGYKLSEAKLKQQAEQEARQKELQDMQMAALKEAQDRKAYTDAIIKAATNQGVGQFQSPEMQADIRARAGAYGSPKDLEAAGVLQPQVAPTAMKPTSLMTNLMAMGLQPGTPEFNSAMKAQMASQNAQAQPGVFAPTFFQGPDGKWFAQQFSNMPEGWKPDSQVSKPPGQMSATAQKELFEADEMAMASQNVIDNITRAENLNSKTYSGVGAGARAKIYSQLPGAQETADATVEYDNLVTGQALESLKATFGGMPTEGERKVLMDLQASVNKTPEQRKAILARAKQLAEIRLKFNTQKAESLRSGTYMKGSVQSPANMDWQGSVGSSPAQSGKPGWSIKAVP